MSTIHGVTVYSWNPGRIRLPLLGRRIGPGLNNFGDLLGPDVVTGVLAERMQHPRAASTADGRRPTLFAVGSVLHFAEAGDVVWGSGINGKTEADYPYPRPLDVRALRGPKSQTALLAAGVDVGDVPFGDPGLLAPARYGISRATAPSIPVGVVPNFNERRRYRRHDGFIDPLGSPESVIARIAECEVVVGSSLHGQVIADALGIPCWPTSTPHEPPFKYQDYYLGLGADPVAPAADIATAVKNAVAFSRTEGSRLATWSSRDLLDAFPDELWEEDET